MTSVLNKINGGGLWILGLVGTALFMGVYYMWAELADSAPWEWGVTALLLFTSYAVFYIAPALTEGRIKDKYSWNLWYAVTFVIMHLFLPIILTRVSVATQNILGVFAHYVFNWRFLALAPSLGIFIFGPIVLNFLAGVGCTKGKSRGAIIHPQRRAGNMSV